MARLLKCYGWCDSKYPKIELTQYKNKNYCKECYKRKVEDDDGRIKLLDTISNIYNIPYPTGMMLRQMKQFREERNYKYNDQAKALWYGKHVLKKQFYSSYGLGLIPYIIDDAVKYFEDNKKRQEKMKDVSSVNKTQTITKTWQENDKQLYRKNKMIDMEGILNE